jgi:hypothetical protein
VRQRVAATAGAAVVPDEEGGIEGLVESLDHGEGVAVVAAAEPGGRGERGGGQVASVAVGIFDQHVVGAGSQGAGTGGGHLGVHLGPKGGVTGLALPSLVAGRDAGDTLDVGADEHLHVPTLRRR